MHQDFKDDYNIKKISLNSFDNQHYEFVSSSCDIKS